jgi:uncharacterized repeat protein (TIGR03806 family)
MKRWWLLLGAMGACAGDDPAAPAPAGDWTRLPAAPFRTLAEYRLFEGSGATQRPAEGVVAYEVTSPLFSDETVKRRFLALPPGARIGYRDDGVWRLPVGTVLVKTFAYPRDARDPALGERLLETRLLIRARDGWTVHTYVWNDAQTEAVRRVGGSTISARWVDAAGAQRANEYAVPNNNQCLTCHGQLGSTDALGLRTAMLDRPGPLGANQVDALAALGRFDGAVPPMATRDGFVDPADESADLERRARAYLHANCAHCHNPGDTSTAMPTGLNLDLAETAAINLGVCRRPNAAGRGTGGFAYDVVPGHPEQSVLVFRMRSLDPELRMPVIPNNLVSEPGVALVSRWIASMPAVDCAAR